MFTEVNNKVLQFFFNNPTKSFHLREVARLVGLSAAGALKILRRLEKEKLVLRQKTKATDNFKANLENKGFQDLKYVYNVYMVKSSGLIDFLNDKYHLPETVVLFGSYSKGEDIETSDIDIAVVTKKEVSLDLRKFEKVLNRKVVVQEIDLKSVSKEFVNNLVNGVVLSGFLKIK